MRLAPWLIQRLPLRPLKRLVWNIARRHPIEYSCATPMGYIFSGNTRDWIQRHIYYFGAWEPNLTTWIKRTLLPGKVFIDVGANIGYFSVLASGIVGPSGKVIAIEPAPQTYERLSYHVAINRMTNVRLINEAAFGPGEATTIKLYVADERNVGATSIAPRWSPSESRTASVTARPLASMLSADEIHRARVIKIDVEGAEAEVVKGLGLERNSFPDDVEIVVEIFNECPEDGPRAQKLLDYMQSLGFNAYLLPETHRLREYYASAARRVVPRRLSGPLQRTDNVIFSRRDAATL